MGGPAKQATRLRQGEKETSRVVRPQEPEQQVDVAVIWRVERNRMLHRRDHRGRHRDAYKHGMRNRETITRRSRPKTLTAQEHV